MNIRILLIASLCAVFLAGCSDQPESKPATTGDHIFKTQTDALKKAQELEGVLQKNVEERDKRIQQQGG